MEYNAVIREWTGTEGSEQSPGRIVGRVLLTDLKDLQGSNCLLRFGGQWEEKVDLSLCSPTKPLQIYTQSPPDFKWNVIPITVVEMPTGKQLSFSMSMTDTVEMIKKKIRDTEGLPRYHLRLIFQGLQLEDFRTIGDYLVTERVPYQPITLHTPLFQRVIPRAFVADIEGKQVAAVAGSTNLSWADYEPGMNLVGQCPNPRCKSKETPERKDVVFHAGYDPVVLKSTSNKFPCPACHPTLVQQPARTHRGLAESDSEYSGKFLFTPSNFVVGQGRTLFRFKKAGAGHPEIKTVLLESLGEYPEIKTFEERGAQEAEYDFVEITTVKPEKSPFCCVGCDRQICCRYHELILTCGHVFHSYDDTPTLDDAESCVVCNAKKFTGEELLVFIPGFLLSPDNKCGSGGECEQGDGISTETSSSSSSTDTDDEDGERPDLPSESDGDDELGDMRPVMEDLHEVPTL